MKGAATPVKARWVPVQAARWAYGLLLLSTFAGAARLWAAWASGASLHVDEAQYWDWSRQLAWGYHSKPPGIALLIRVSTALFGDDETAVRALAMACWPLTALVLAWLARARARVPPRAAADHTERTLAGWWAAALLLASPLASLLGLVATTDGPLMLCSALVLAALWAALEQGRPGAWWVWALAMAAGLLCKYTMAALLVGSWLLVLLRHGAQWPRLAMATVLVLLLICPHLWWNAQQGWPTWRHTAEITVQRRSTGGVWAMAAFVAAQVLALAPVVVVLRAREALSRLAAMVARLAKAPARPGVTWPTLVWPVVPLALAGVLQAARSGAEPNWVAPVHLVVAVLLAQTQAAAPAAWQRQLRWWLLVQVLLFTLLPLAPQAARSMGMTWPVAADPWARMRGWRPALDELVRSLPGGAGNGGESGAGQAAASPPVLLVSPSRSVIAQAHWHWRGRGVQMAAWRSAPLPGHHYEGRCPQGPELPAGAVVYVLADAPLPAALTQAWGPLTEVARVERLPGRTLHLWQVAAAAPRSRHVTMPPCRT